MIIFSNIVHELFYKSSHLLLLDETISVLIEIKEKFLECLQVWNLFTLGHTEVFKEIGSLDLVQSSTSIDVVLNPYLVDLFFNKVLLIKESSSIENWLLVDLIDSN